MIDGAIAGKVCGRPEIRSGKGGKAAVVVRIRAAAAGGEGVQVNVAAYVHEVREVLLARQQELAGLSGQAARAVVRRMEWPTPSVDRSVRRMLHAVRCGARSVTFQATHGASTTHRAPAAPAAPRCNGA